MPPGNPAEKGAFEAHKSSDPGTEAGACLNLGLWQEGAEGAAGAGGEGSGSASRRGGVRMRVRGGCWGGKVNHKMTECRKEEAR